METFSEFDTGTRNGQAVSTTMAFVRLLRNLTRVDGIGSRIVPIVPDEARTFGMDPLFSQLGIYSPLGQLCTPVDYEVLMRYKESKTGQILEEGINEAGAMSTFIASGKILCYSGNPYNSILHLLLYVRVPTDWRSSMVRRG